jgi:hypothetical protein
MLEHIKSIAIKYRIMILNIKMCTTKPPQRHILIFNIILIEFMVTKFVYFSILRF